MGKKLYYTGIAALLFFAGCGSLEDTYSEFTEGGPIRYVGICTKMKVTTGWERLSATWTNSLDQTVENIRVVCTGSNGYVLDTLLAADETSLDIDELADGNYQIDVYSMDHYGTLSLPLVGFGRPYTLEHELVTGFSRMILKHYFVKDNLVLFWDKWPDALTGLRLTYYNMAGTLKDVTVDRTTVNSKYLTIEDVDTDRPIVLYRKGYPEGCIDEVEFEDYTLGNARGFTPDMKIVLQERYGVSEVTDAFVNERETLELDYDLATLEDILYFPNLKTLYLGKNRYLHPTHLTGSYNGYNALAASVLSDVDKGKFILRTAQQLLGLTIERYYRHYFPVIAAGDGITIIENGTVPPSLPNLVYLNAPGWTITNSVAGDISGTLGALLDNDPATYWEPTPASTTSQRTHELVIDMQSMQSVQGLVVVQPYANLAVSAQRSWSMYYQVNLIVQYSTDQSSWKNFAHTRITTIGKSTGEKTLIPMAEPGLARYIRITAFDRTYSSVTKTMLADIAVY